MLGVIELKDIVKTHIKERFAELRRMGIKTIMITGDNKLTAASIAAEAGVDDFLAEVTPEAKLKLIRDTQAQGKLVAMTGDGTNDAPALAQADVAVVMNSGTQAAKEAGNMVDLDSNPTKLIEIVEIGKQLLMTRGALTTFSIANDVAKYFAIIPAAFASTYPVLEALNVMKLATPASAILSAVIFNALIIPALIPLALKGVKYRPVGAGAILRRNMLIYGVGGILLPFVGIKLIDMLLVGDEPRLTPRRTIMFGQFLPALRMLVVLSVLTGVIYPYLVTGIAQLAFPRAANGSLIQSDGKARGIGSDRPAVRRPEILLEPAVGDLAAAVQRRRVERIQPGPAQPGAGRRGEGSHQGAARRGSRQQGPRARRSRDGVRQRARPRHQRRGRELPAAIASPRRAAMPEDKVRALVDASTLGRTFGILGEPRVNVLALNLALDRSGR